MNDDTERLAALKKFIDQHIDRLEQGVDFAHHSVMRFAFLYKAALDTPCQQTITDAETAMTRLQTEWGAS